MHQDVYKKQIKAHEETLEQLKEEKAAQRDHLIAVEELHDFKHKSLV